jgi:hypothetical protein
VVPDNSAILRVLNQNRALLRPDEREAADLYGIHVADFEARQVLGEWSAASPTFPSGMDAIFEDAE